MTDIQPYIAILVKDDNRLIRPGLRKSCRITELSEGVWSFGFIDTRQGVYDNNFTRPRLRVQELKHPSRYEITVEQCMTDSTLELLVNGVKVLDDVKTRVGSTITFPLEQIPRYSCPKCKSQNTQICERCEPGQYKCIDCGFVAPEDVFRTGILPSQRVKPRIAAKKEQAKKTSILFMTANREGLVRQDHYHRLEIAVSKIADCRWAGYGQKDYINEPLDTTIQRLYGNGYPDWVIMSPYLSGEGEDGRRWDTFTAPANRRYKIAAIVSDLHCLYLNFTAGSPEDYVQKLNNAGYDAILMLYTHLAVKNAKGEPITPDYFLKKLRAKTFHLPVCLDPEVYKPSEESKQYDVVFLGCVTKDIYPLRTQIWQGLKEWPDKSTRILMKPRPKGKPNERQIQSMIEEGYIVGDKYVEALARSKAFIFGSSIYKYPLAKYFEGMACGTLVMADKPLTSESLHLVPGETFVEINSGNWVSRLKYYLTHKNAREVIARNGHKAFLEHHTCEVRARQLVEWLTIEKDTPKRMPAPTTLTDEILAQSYLYDSRHYRPGVTTILPQEYNLNKLCLIIPVCNQAHALTDCLNSFVNQLKPFDEVIVVDAGSTQDIKAVTDAFQGKIPSIKYIRQESRSIANARNVGVLSLDYGKWRSGSLILWNVKSCPPEGIIDAYRRDRTFDPPIDDIKSIAIYSANIHKSALRTLLSEFDKHGLIYFWVDPADPKQPLSNYSYPSANIFITCTSEHARFKRFRPTKTVFMQHGLNPVELSCFTAHRLHRFRAALIVGPWWMEQIQRGVFEIDCTKFRKNFFHMVGWPKGDILFTDGIEEAANNVIKRFNIKLPYEKTVLYAPTGMYYMGYSSFRGTILKLIQESMDLQFNLIVKSHPHINRREMKDLIVKARSICRKSNNATWLDCTWLNCELEDITPLYHIADILVSDASSTLIEFLQVDKPNIEMMNRGYDEHGVFHSNWVKMLNRDRPRPILLRKKEGIKHINVLNTEQWFKLDDELIMDLRKAPTTAGSLQDWVGFSMPDGCTIKCWTINDLHRTLIDAMNNPQKHSKNRKAWQSKMFYKLDGKSGKRAAEVIRGLL